MISLNRLARLGPNQLMRKVFLELRAEEERLGAPGASRDLDALLSLLDFLANLQGIDPELKAAAKDCGGEIQGPSASWALSRLSALIARHLGLSQADWDLRDPGSHRLLRVGDDGMALADKGGGVGLYLEDIRSPFNVGSIFRSAEAFGVDRLLISQACADPLHPRASRSAMGCVEAIAWERRPQGLSQEELSRSFALEVGGSPLDSFNFPEKGICVIGNEELGVDPRTIAACALGRVSIPMGGAKASLNVAVASGILLQAWRAHREDRKPKMSRRPSPSTPTGE